MSSLSKKIKSKYWYRRLKLSFKNSFGMPVSLEELTYAYIRPDFYILEAGAHVGGDTQMLAYFTRNELFAFEPIPDIFRKLEQNTRHIKNVRRFHVALSDQTGTTMMYVSSGASDASSSLLEPVDHLNTNPDVAFEETITIPTITLDDWAREHGVDRVDFMWLDMQGYEWTMLNASTRIFPTVKVIYTEVSTIELYKGQKKYDSFKQWLFDRGFKLLREDLSWGHTGNALFVKK